MRACVYICVCSLPASWTCYCRCAEGNRGAGRLTCLRQLPGHPNRTSTNNLQPCNQSQVCPAKTTSRPVAALVLLGAAARGSTHIHTRTSNMCEFKIAHSHTGVRCREHGMPHALLSTAAGCSSSKLTTVPCRARTCYHSLASVQGGTKLNSAKLNSAQISEFTNITRRCARRNN